MSKHRLSFAATLVLAALPLIARAQPATPSAPDPTRIVIECEDMTGVDQTKFGPGKTWQVGRWGQDLYQNMVFGGVWASRTRVAMTDGTSTPAEAYSDITVPADGTYKIWTKYECPPFFNYAFGVRVESLDGADKTTGKVFEKTYGLRESAKHFSFTDKLQTGDLFWQWGIDHDAAEGYQAALKKGRYRVTIFKTQNPAPAAARSLDAILITSDLSEISTPRQSRYPLLDELRRANHVYFRFRNLSGQPARISWNHWNHRYPDFYAPSYRELVKFYDAGGNALPAPANNTGTWPEPLAANASSVWHDLGPTMNVESTSPFQVKMLPVAATDSGPGEVTPSVPFAVDIALAPNDKSIVKTFQTEAGDTELDFLVQPDLMHKEGAEYTKKLGDVYRDIIAGLNAEPRLGPIPKIMKFYAGTGGPSPASALGTKDFEAAQEFRLALGLNTIESNRLDKTYLDAVASWWQNRGGLQARSVAFQHSQKPEEIAAMVKKNGIEKYFKTLSFGDEIGLPPIDVKDAAKVAAFRDYVKASGETPQTLGLENWDQVKPLEALSADVAMQIGVLPTNAPKTDAQTNKLKRLFWYSSQFRIAQGIENFAQKTQQTKALLGDDVQTTANLGGMHPFYWMPQASFIEAFKRNAMTLAWSEDYTYSQPEASHLVADFEASYMRKGASYHDTLEQFYCMPHYPGNTPEHLMQNAVMLWANNIKDIDWFVASPDAWSTENFITYRGGLPMWKMLRQVSGMAGLIEDDLVPARPVSTPVAMLVSESSDVWELEGKSQWDVTQTSVASNVSQEERKNIWYALRNAGYRVDVITEDDVKEGLLDKYKVLYVCGQNLQRASASKLKTWVQNGGMVFATAGAARKNEFDEPSNALDEVLGRGAQKSYTRYHGALRAKMELLFQKPLDQVGDKQTSPALPKIPAVFPALCSKETFAVSPKAQVLSCYASDNSPAWIKNSFGKGTAYYTGTLPGEAYVQRALPVVPMGKGGDEKNSSHFEPIDYDGTARDMILRPIRDAGIVPDVIADHRGVVTGRLASTRSVVIPIVNLAEQHDGQLKNLQVTLTGVAKKPGKVWSCFNKNGVPFEYSDGKLTLTLPSLQTADVIVISQQ